MCGRFELKTKFENLPTVLKQDYPSGLDSKYETQSLIRPNDPVLVIKNEGRIKTTFMTWGFISPWARDPFDKERPRPFNARSETVKEKKLFSGSWKHKRCLIPASGFLKKNFVCENRIMKLFGWAEFGVSGLHQMEQNLRVAAF